MSCTRRSISQPVADQIPASDLSILTLLAAIGRLEEVAALLEDAISGGRGIVAAASVMQQKDFFLLFNQQDPNGLSADASSI